MALGTMSVLGISSNLSSDNIQQLKENEEYYRLTPTANRISKNMEQQTELTSLLLQLTSLNGNFKALSDFSTFQRRNTTVEGSGVKATAGEGLALQDIKINVKQLAQNDINQVGMKFASRDSVFTSKNTTIDFYHNGTNYSIDVKAGSTLSEVAQSITDATNGEVTGIIMKTGGDNPYQLMINAKDSGRDHKIYFGSTLESAATPGGKITSGTLNVEIGGKTLSVDLSTIGSDFGYESKDNAQAILKKLEEEIAKDPDLQAKVDSGEITIGLRGDGKGLMFNDATGGQIKVEVVDAKIQASMGTSEESSDLGFVKTSTETKDMIVGGKVNNGQLNGKLLINGKAIDLSAINGSNNAEEVANAINAQFTNGEVTASVKDGKLVLNSSDGSDIIITAEGASEADKNKILSSVGLTGGTFSSSAGFLKEMNITNIQKAQNAVLTYNGIEIERDKNTIDDIVSGLSLELTSITEADKEVIVRVSRDDSGIADEMASFVENYNAVYNKIQELVRYDEDTEVAGVFNGNSEIRSIIRQLNSLITSNDTHGRNLMQYGVSMNDDGTLKLDRDKFNSKFQEDPDEAISFFRSSTSVINGQTKEVNGVFANLRDLMDNLTTDKKGSNGQIQKGTLKALEESLQSEQKSLEKERTRTQESIDTKYDMMAEKWVLYDQMIAKIQQSANTITQMIQMAMNQ